MSHRTQFYLSNIYTLVVWKLVLREKQIKALFPCKLKRTRAEVERRSEGKKRGSDGGWKWSGASVLCECLCAAIAKKNKAWAMLGSDFSMEACQETGFSEVVVVVGGGYTSHPPREKRKRFRQNNPPLHSPPKRLWWLTYSHHLSGWRILIHITRHRLCSCQ